ncbi:DpnII family type II restriction endonuclease [Rothia nasimurium]|nr:DpnII family type II restriction endonuclease [Rothia nasimurium]
MSQAKYSVFDYLSLTPDERYNYFLKTRSEISHVASYWFNFENVKKNVAKYDSPDLHSLTYLIGKTDDDVDVFFRSRPETLLLVPYLLGIRNTAFKEPTENRILGVSDSSGSYDLNFQAIETGNIEQYLRFVRDSGLSWLLTSGVKKSSYDYAVGVEAGMDSNGRKNRSGNAGEGYLTSVLKGISMRTGYEQRGQTRAEDIKKLYGITLEDSLAKKRFDGILYNKQRRQLYLFEVNNFNSSGSKVKSMGVEFARLGSDIHKTNHEFIYITDGRGWDKQKEDLRSAIKNINKVFNYSMVEGGYLRDLIG